MNSLSTADARFQQNKEAAVLAEQMCLPIRSRAWRGSSGAWQGLNQGSSIDFQDHRAYMPGDDPRHLDWAAYARTNHYTMKLFREEVSPRLDIALDVSPSMALTPAKEARTLALLALVLHMALHDAINPRVYAVHSAGQWSRLDPHAALALNSLPSFPRVRGKVSSLPLSEIPWRFGSLRLLISDLLIPQAPEVELVRLNREHSHCIILAPYLQAEAEPDWRGNLDLHDCETRLSRHQRVDPLLLTRYRASYQRHFETWSETARKRNIPFARISCELSLTEAVRQQALPAGAFVLRH